MTFGLPMRLSACASATAALLIVLSTAASAADCRALLRAYADNDDRAQDRCQPDDHDNRLSECLGYARRSLQIGEALMRSRCDFDREAVRRSNEFNRWELSLYRGSGRSAGAAQRGGADGGSSAPQVRQTFCPPGYYSNGVSCVMIAPPPTTCTGTIMAGQNC
mgnify:CR=1 FL=1